MQKVSFKCLKNVFNCHPAIPKTIIISGFKIPRVQPFEIKNPASWFYIRAHGSTDKKKKSRTRPASGLADGGSLVESGEAIYYRNFFWKIFWHKMRVELTLSLFGLIRFGKSTLATKCVPLFICVHLCIFKYIFLHFSLFNHQKTNYK